MDMTATSPQRFDIGRVVQRTFESMGRNLGLLLLLGLLLAVLPAVVFGWAQYELLGKLGGEAASGHMPAASVQSIPMKALFWAGSGLTNLVLAFILQAAVIHAIIADLNGRRSSLSECLSTGFRHFLPLLGIAILMAIALVFGLILLIVPAFMMTMAWIVAVPAEVVEQTGVMRAFSRSAALTRGHRWAIFALVLVYSIALGVVEMALLGLSGGFAAQAIVQRSWILSMVVTPLLQMLSLVGLVGVASIYFELRVLKDGVLPQTLASVFD